MFPLGQHMDSIALEAVFLRLSVLILHRQLTHSIRPDDATASSASSTRLNRIYIAGLFPLTSPNGGVNAAGVLPSVRLALEHVNRNSSLLPNHILDLDFNDTQCDMAVGSKVFFDMMHNPPPKVVVFGDACSEVTVPIAETAVWWNMIQISYADTNPVLSDRTKYPFFFRTVPSDTDFNMARIQMLLHYQWKRVATIFQDASSGSSRHAMIHSRLTESLDNEGIHRQTESFSSDPKTALNHIKQKDLRIILGDFDSGMARLVFCAAYELGLYGAKYVWLLAGRYPDDWWKTESPRTSCSIDQMEEALEGFIGTDVLPLSKSDERTISGLTSSEYLDLYNRQRKTSYSKFHGYAYDGIWAIAQAADSFLNKAKKTSRIRGRLATGNDEGKTADGRETGKRKRRKGRTRSNGKSKFRSKRFHRELNNISFTGVTGRLAFKNGDRLGSVILEQFQGGQMVGVGQMNSLTNVLRIESNIRWTGAAAPRDGSHKVHQLQTVNAVVYASISCLAALGIVLSCSFLVLNIKFRNHRYIKMSSPNMNNIILTGCMFTYCSVFLLGIDGRIVRDNLFPFTCSLKIWVFCIGFTLSFGAMFSKTWRVHSIFTNIQLNKKVIKDYKLILIVNFLLSIDLVILTAWQIFDPPHRMTIELSPQTDPSGIDVEFIPYLEFCVSQHRTIFLVAIYVYKGLLLVVGCFLAWETRNVSIAALNDSKYIGMSVYSVVITCVAGVPVTFLLGDRPNTAYLIIALFVIFATTVTLCLVFGPKLIEIRRDPSGEEKRIMRTLRKSIRSENDSPPATRNQRIIELSNENRCYREIIETRQKEIQSLLHQLGNDAFAEEDSSSSCSVFESPSPPTSKDTRPKQFEIELFCRLNDSSSWKRDSRNSYHHVTIASSKQNRNTAGTTRKRSKDNSIEMTEISTSSTVISNPFSVNCFERRQRINHRNRSHEGTNTAQIIATSTSSCSVRTPSYQGLKFLAEIQLRETAIISDSSEDEELSQSHSPTSFNSFQEPDDDSSAEVTKALLQT